MMHIIEATRKPNVFLSHSSIDKKFVRKLANDLGVCEIDVWLDEWEIEPGDSIYKAISNGIEASKYVALVLSEAFLESKWATQEVESAFTKQMEQKSKVILPLVIEKVKLPTLISGQLYISFIDNYYESLTRLVGLLHGIESRIISQAINHINPEKFSQVVECLRHCGINPYMIIPKEVFAEIANTKCVEINQNRMRIPDPNYLLSLPLSGNTKKYIEGIQRESDSNLFDDSQIIC